MIDFLYAALTRHPPLSGDAATKIGALQPWASCAVLISQKGCNRVCENCQSKFKITIRSLTILEYNIIFASRVFAYNRFI